MFPPGRRPQKSPTPQAPIPAAIRHEFEGNRLSQEGLFSVCNNPDFNQELYANLWAMDSKELCAAASAQVANVQRGRYKTDAAQKFGDVGSSNRTLLKESDAFKTKGFAGHA